MRSTKITSGSALQDNYGENYDECYGCGPHNSDGLQLKSYWDGKQTTAQFSATEKHKGISGFVYGGLLASLIDCHAMAAAGAHYNQSHPELDALPRFVTGTMTVKYIKPTPLCEHPIELVAVVTQIVKRRSTVNVKVRCDGQITAEGEVIAFLIPETMV